MMNFTYGNDAPAGTPILRSQTAVANSLHNLLIINYKKQKIPKKDVLLLPVIP